MLVVPDDVFARVENLHGVFIEALSGIDRRKATADALDGTKPALQAQILQRYVALDGKRVLEVGSGLGMNLIGWTRDFNADMVGIEPNAVGFDSSAEIARALAAANGVDPHRIIDAVGESLPFPDRSFDVVYSTNVLEHTNDPPAVLHEAMRVLRPGGVMQFVYPNFHSYFDGHYGVFHPPLFGRRFFPWYVKTFYRRDPAFARTLRTEVTARWARKQVANLRASFDFDLLGLGEDVFLERMTSMNFASWSSLVRVKRLLELVANRAVRRGIARFMIATGAWTPVILTLRRRA